jgi:hypothetical protein
MRKVELVGQLFNRDAAVWTYKPLNVHRWRSDDPSKFVGSFLKKQAFKITDSKLRLWKSCMTPKVGFLRFLTIVVSSIVILINGTAITHCSGPDINNTESI